MYNLGGIVLQARLASQQASSFLLKSAVEVAVVTVNGRRFQSATTLEAKENLRRFNLAAGCRSRDPSLLRPSRSDGSKKKSAGTSNLPEWMLKHGVTSKEKKGYILL